MENLTQVQWESLHWIMQNFPKEKLDSYDIIWFRELQNKIKYIAEGKDIDDMVRYFECQQKSIDLIIKSLKKTTCLPL